MAMNIIKTHSVYVWCEQRQCVGVLDGLNGCGTTLGGPSVACVVLLEMMRS